MKYKEMDVQRATEQTAAKGEDRGSKCEKTRHTERKCDKTRKQEEVERERALIRKLYEKRANTVLWPTACRRDEVPAQQAQKSARK